MTRTAEVKHAFQAVLDPYSPIDTGGVNLLGRITDKDNEHEFSAPFYGLAKTVRGMTKSRASAAMISIVSYSPEDVVSETDDTVWVTACKVAEIVDFVKFLQFGGSPLAHSVLPGRKDLEGGRLTDVHFGRLDLTDANFKDANLAGSDFSDAIAPNACFAGADLTRCNFNGSVVSDADFTNVTAVDATFNSTFGERTNFTGANLQGADMRWSLVNGSSFENADVRGARFDGVDISNLNMTGVTVEENMRFTDRVRHYLHMAKWLGIGRRK